MNRIISFLKKDVLLSVSAFLALVSVLSTGFSAERFMALDWKTIAILSMLLSVLEGFKKESLFDPLLRAADRIGGTFALSSFLVFSVFILSPIVTNDVALITFVPMTIMVLRNAEKERFTAPVVAIETIAANLGSVLTPFGNPQNLFIYGKMGIRASEFMLMMLPLFLFSLALIAASLAFVFRNDMRDRIYIHREREEKERNSGLSMLYICLFVAVLLSVFGLFPFQSIFLVVLAVLIVFDRPVLRRIDYPLLATFLCFFVFSDAVSSSESVKGVLSGAMHDHGFLIPLIACQAISNVPAAILLEPFSGNLRTLLLAVDIGGLGTPIASLASLISLRAFMKEYPGLKGEYLKVFTLLNLAFLALSVPFGLLLSR